MLQVLYVNTTIYPILKLKKNQVYKTNDRTWHSQYKHDLIFQLLSSTNEVKQNSDTMERDQRVGGNGL